MASASLADGATSFWGMSNASSVRSMALVRDDHYGTQTCVSP
jgi:hypothetical protein